MIQTIETIIKRLTNNPVKYWARVTDLSVYSKCVEFNYPIRVKITLEIISTPIDKFKLDIETEHLQPINMLINKKDGLHMRFLIDELKKACIKETRNYLKNIILSL
jgi:hypothetical protein